MQHWKCPYRYRKGRYQCSYECELVSSLTGYCIRWMFADLEFSNDIARSGGIIMDRCTRGDNTVSGTAYIPQGGVAVHIQHS